MAEPIPDAEMADAPDTTFDPAMEAESNGSAPKRLPVTVTKPIPYTFDLGNLLCNDANPLPSDPSPSDLSSTARDCAQALINQLLSTCEIKTVDGGLAITLPPPATPLPREKQIPKEKEPTKWEKFAAKKGIKAKKREGNKVYDEATGEWVPKWGYKGANKKGEDEWLVEVDEKKEAQTGEAGDVRREKRAERKERLRRQDRKERANAARGATSS
jgi:regulator of ribosome biosynthesis